MGHGPFAARIPLRLSRLCGVTSSQVTECFQPPQACELLCGKKEKGASTILIADFAAKVPFWKSKILFIAHCSLFIVHSGLVQPRNLK
jgi:hypothetical protein